MNKTITIAIIGLGQVGNYLYRELNLKKKDIEKKNWYEYSNSCFISKK